MNFFSYLVLEYVLGTKYFKYFQFILQLFLEIMTISNSKKNHLFKKIDHITWRFIKSSILFVYLNLHVRLLIR